MSDKGDEDVAQIEVARQDGGGDGGGGSSSSSSGADATSHDRTKSPAIHNNGRRGLQAPEFLLHLSMEERHVLEAKLKRKIDLRLMPAIILMYILNYIDRWVTLFSSFFSLFVVLFAPELPRGGGGQVG